MTTQLLRDFATLDNDNMDATVKNALLDFSFYLTVGNMDEAYKAVKLIKNTSVWKNMADMCVKTKRLDVAEVCLGNMGHARGARAVREAKADVPELEGRIAMVAVQLGLIEDAERLYKECGRFDKLNELFQAGGQWGKAMDTAESRDRIHLRSTHYRLARYLESVGDTQGAIREYENAGVASREVPRMLHDVGQLGVLEDYVNQSSDKELLKWWAQYCECQEQFDEALRFYQQAHDALGVVRVHCYSGNVEAAERIVEDSQDAAAAFHLARQHESVGAVDKAIHFFGVAGRYNHAVRLAKEHGLDSELMSLALMSDPEVMTEAAMYYEEKGLNEQAVQLYQKGGRLSRAIDLCFRAQLFDVLRTIADDADEETSPQTLARCASFFLEHGQFDKAVSLYITSNRYDEAIELCTENKVTITEDMAERMTLPKTDNPADHPSNARRNAMLLKIAQTCKRQGSFHLATKKYTQAGEKVKAMKCLLKSGDTQKIMFFAQVSRNKEIYILAANYLQSLDWHSDAQIMKAIITSYGKARSYEQLSAFYDACAQAEIDEYRDYEKALGCLKDAVKYAMKSRSSDKQSRLEVLQQRVSVVERFVAARKNVKTDPAETVKVCHQLLDSNAVEGSIRQGDVYALLVDYYYGQRNLEQAYALIEKMRQRNIILSPYLDQDMVQDIYKAMGVTQTQEEEHDDGIAEVSRRDGVCG